VLAADTRRGLSRTHVLASEDYFADPRRVLDEIYAFLRVPPIDTRHHTHENKGVYSANEVDPKTRADLAARYAVPNDELRQRYGVSW
jgi:hypothetical protein